jgi:very-short-patch-repair endonuclease
MGRKKGSHISEEQKLKQSLTTKGKPHSDEHNQRMRDAVRRPESRMKKSESAKRICTKEFCARRAASLKLYYAKHPEVKIEKCNLLKGHNPMHNPETVAKNHIGQKGRKRTPQQIENIRVGTKRGVRKFFDENPEKHPNRLCAKINKFSSLEKAIDEYLHFNKINHEHQHPTGHYYSDFFLLECNLLVEADGSYWHKDKTKDEEKDRSILQVHPDYRILHLQEDVIKSGQFAEELSVLAFKGGCED